jgi:hypothetical protein
LRAVRAIPGMPQFGRQISTRSSDTVQISTRSSYTVQIALFVQWTWIARDRSLNPAALDSPLDSDFVDLQNCPAPRIAERISGRVSAFEALQTPRKAMPPRLARKPLSTVCDSQGVLKPPLCRLRWTRPSVIGCAAVYLRKSSALWHCGRNRRFTNR